MDGSMACSTWVQPGFVATSVHHKHTPNASFVILLTPTTDNTITATLEGFQGEKTGVEKTLCYPFILHLSITIVIFSIFIFVLPENFALQSHIIISALLPMYHKGMAIIGLQPKLKLCWQQTFRNSCGFDQLVVLASNRNISVLRIVRIVRRNLKIPPPLALRESRASINQSVGRVNSFEIHRETEVHNLIIANV
ncbi:hypothetical protein GQX74_008693 [Glossina fuscipes]|nr:hypothetical protein GQX74_008693 [Glossina fuscipes]